MNESRPTRVYPILALGLICFAMSPILIRFADEAPAMAIAVWRTALAAVLLLPFAFRRIGKEVRQFSRREWGLIIGAGIMLGLHFVAWIESLYHTTVASASVLVWTNPIIMAVLGFFFLHERISRGLALGIALAMGGAALLGWGDWTDTSGQASNPMLGNGLAFTAAVLVSIYLVIGRVVRQRYSWLAYVLPLYGVVSLTTLGMALMLDTPLFGYSPTFYVLCLLMALGPSIAGHGSFNYAVRYLPVALLGVLSLLEPVGASIAAYFLFDEIPNLFAVIGMLLVLFGVTFALRTKDRSHG
ncbi:MAG: DMT family transporter [Rhodothermales bacterium]